MRSTVTDSEFELPLRDSFLESSADLDGMWHRLRSLKYGQLLHEIHGGDIDVICATLLLYEDDSASSRSRSASSSGPKIQTVAAALQRIRFPSAKSDAVFRSLQAHSAIGQNPRTTEDKIVKDAICLAELGASGLLRLFKADKLGSLAGLRVGRIKEYFRRRFNGLVYRESRATAERENKLAYLFGAELQREPRLETQHGGRYIVLEGNSGVGKNTQARILKEHFEQSGRGVIIVEEPTQVYRDLEAKYRNDILKGYDDASSPFRMYSIIGDRKRQISDLVMTSLAGGNIVISVRSFLSMLVYQCESEIDRLSVNYIHGFVPRPDVVVLLDANVRTCFERVKARAKTTGVSISEFDKMNRLSKYRPIYLEMAEWDFLDFPVKIIDASESIHEVAARTLAAVQKYID